MKIFLLFSAICALVLESEAFCNQGAVYTCVIGMVQDPNLRTKPCEVYNTFVQCIDTYRSECEGTPFWTNIMGSFEQTEQICAGNLPQVNSGCDVAAIEQCSGEMVEADNVFTEPCSVYTTFTECIKPYEADCQTSEMWNNMQSQMQTLNSICG